MRYVTFDAAGTITGCYLQDLLIAHEDAYLEIDEDAARNWTGLRIDLVATMVDVEVLAPGEVEGEFVTVIQQESRMVPQLAERIPDAPVITIPAAVTMRQARLALLAAGMLTTVTNAVATMEGADGDKARIEWEFSSEVRRNQPLVLALAPALGLTDAQLDDLFIAAAAL